MGNVDEEKAASQLSCLSHPRQHASTISLYFWSDPVAFLFFTVYRRNLSRLDNERVFCIASFNLN